MPNNAQAARRVKSSRKANDRKKAQRSTLRTLIKKTRAMIESNDSNAAESFKTVQKKLAQFASKGLLPKNTASRLTSRISAQLKSSK